MSTDTSTPTASNVPTAQVFAKRLNWFTGYILILFAISIVVWLANFDAKDDTDDYEALKLLSELPDGYITEPDSRRSFKEDWLRKHDPSLLQRCNEAKSLLVEQLSQLGLNEGAWFASNLTEKPSRFSLVDINFTDDEMKRIERNGPDYRTKKRLNVGERLEVYEILYRPRALTVVIELKIPLNEPKDHSNGSGILAMKKEERKFQVESFLLDRKLESIVVSCKWNGPSPKSVDEPTGKLVYKAKTVEVQEFSLAVATSIESEFGRQFYEDPGRKERLKTIYGTLDIENAKSIASERLVRAYTQKDVLGTSFSTKRLPLAMTVLVLLFSIGIWVTVKQAVRYGLKPITGFYDESVMSLIISWPLTRLLAFLLFPLSSILVFLLWSNLSSHPLYPLSIREYAFLAILAVAVIGLGVETLRQTRKL